jgi:wyosine [tRNA(Phe)-imidazoG37] synthetase (radical SAM superfamily)
VSQIVDAAICAPGLGLSLNVNFTPPACRTCNFDCVYCEVPRKPREGPGMAWPSPGDIASALANALPTSRSESVLVAGCGEPTLHPDFCGAMLAVLGVVKNDRPRLPVRVRTNGSRLHRPEVRRGLDLADERILKLDPAPERTLRPSSRAPFGAIVVGAGTLRDFSIQSVLVEGEDGNCDDSSLAVWLELLAELRPTRVYLSTPDVAVAGGRVRPLSHPRLAAVAAELACRVAISAAIV